MAITSDGLVTVRDDECTPVLTLTTASSSSSASTSSGTGTAAETALAAEEITSSMSKALTPSNATAARAKGAALVQEQAWSGPGSCKFITVWGQCGGKNCPTNYGMAPGQCSDAPYAGYCCLPYWSCERKHQWCVPQACCLAVEMLCGVSCLVAYASGLLLLTTCLMSCWAVCYILLY
jgi:hypothetical protein